MRKTVTNGSPPVNGASLPGIVPANEEVVNHDLLIFFFNFLCPVVVAARRSFTVLHGSFVVVHGLSSDGLWGPEHTGFSSCNTQV